MQTGPGGRAELSARAPGETKLRCGKTRVFSSWAVLLVISLPHSSQLEEKYFQINRSET